jgi:hypothetical protein
MRLKNPGGTAAALDTVKQVKNELWNANVTNGAERKKTAFLSWCNNWATPQLGNHFLASEELFAEIADTYQRLSLAPQMPEAHLNGLLHREWQVWDARLERLIEELQARQAFLRHPGSPVVLDTSALMEGVFFTDYDWHTLHATLNSTSVRLILPSLVIEELDELKRHRDGRRSAKARKVLRHLWELHRAAPAQPATLPQAADVTIEVLLDGDWHRRRQNNDGEIIDQAVAVRELTGQQVILAAADYAQLYRGAPTGLVIALMPRPAEPAEQEQSTG